MTIGSFVLLGLVGLAAGAQDCPSVDYTKLLPMVSTLMACGTDRACAITLVEGAGVSSECEACMVGLTDPVTEYFTCIDMSKLQVATCPSVDYTKLLPKVSELMACGTDRTCAIAIVTAQGVSTECEACLVALADPVTQYFTCIDMSKLTEATCPSVDYMKLIPIVGELLSCNKERDCAVKLVKATGVSSACEDCLEALPDPTTQYVSCLDMSKLQEQDGTQSFSTTPSGSSTMTIIIVVLAVVALMVGVAVFLRFRKQTNGKPSFFTKSSSLSSLNTGDYAPPGTPSNAQAQAEQAVLV